MTLFGREEYIYKKLRRVRATGCISDLVKPYFFRYMSVFELILFAVVKRHVLIEKEEGGFTPFRQWFVSASDDDTANPLTAWPGCHQLF